MCYFVIGFLLVKTNYNTIFIYCLCIVKNQLCQLDLVKNTSTWDKPSLIFMYNFGNCFCQFNCKCLSEYFIVRVQNGDWPVIFYLPFVFLLIQGAHPTLCEICGLNHSMYFNVIKHSGEYSNYIEGQFSSFHICFIFFIKGLP